MPRVVLKKPKQVEETVALSSLKPGNVFRFPEHGSAEECAKKEAFCVVIGSQPQKADKTVIANLKDFIPNERDGDRLVVYHPAEFVAGPAKMVDAE